MDFNIFNRNNNHNNDYSDDSNTNTNNQTNTHKIAVLPYLKDSQYLYAMEKTYRLMQHYSIDISYILIDTILMSACISSNADAKNKQVQIMRCYNTIQLLNTVSISVY